MLTKGITAVGLVLVLSGLSACVLVVNPEEGEIDADWGDNHRVGWHRDQTDVDKNSVLSTPVTEDIQRRFRDDPTLADLNIGVAESRGVVTLSGRATDLETYLRAIDLARSVSGVETVVSRMVVEVRN